MTEELMIAETKPAGVEGALAKPFAHPYYQRLKGFMASRAANYSPHAFPPLTFAPGQVPKAYKFPSNLGTPKATTKYGVGSLGGNVPKSDVTKFCSDNGYPVPNLKVMSIPGADTTNDPSGANVENNLDWQMILQAWHYAFPNTPADITLMIGPNTDTGIADVTTALRKLGCTNINWSWGAAKSQWSASSLTYTETEFAACKAASVAVFAASGDNSANDGTGSKVLDFPCASVNVWGVGGTNMKTTPTGDYLSEKVWGDGLAGDEGGGGGFDTTVPIPSFQQGVVAGSFRGGPDSSANADPASGYQTWSDGTVAVIGGTSASSPLTCGLVGVIQAMGGSLTNFQANLYTNRKTAWTDVTVGSNGTPAAIGWDPASGLGSPIGPGVAAALGVPGTTLPPPPPPPPVGVTVTITPPLPKGTYTITVH